MSSTKLFFPFLVEFFQILFAEFLSKFYSLKIYVIFFYLFPKSNVDLVSCSLYEAGEQQITTVVLALPPNDS